MSISLLYSITLALPLSLSLSSSLFFTLSLPLSHSLSLSLSVLLSLSLFLSLTLSPSVLLSLSSSFSYSLFLFISYLRTDQLLPHSIDSVMFDHLIMAASRADLAGHIGTCDSLTLLFSALYKRKQLSFLSFNTTSDRNNTREARLEHEAALCILNKLLTDVKVLAGVLKVILLLFDNKAIKLASILENSPLGLSLSQLSASRLERNEDMMFLPAVLCSETLLSEELIARLDLKVRHFASLPRDVSYPKGGEPLDPTFYASVARFLWLPLLSVRNVDADLPYSNESNQKELYYKAAAAGQIVVLYVLLDALSLSSSANSSHQTEMLCGEISQAYSLHPVDRIRLYSLWRLDSRLDIQMAVEDLCSPSVALFTDTSLFFAGSTMSGVDG